MSAVGGEVEFQDILMDVEEILLATGGKIITGCKNSSISYVFIDSREVIKNSLFVALQGETLDGHAFIEDALKNGACVVLLDVEHVSKNEMLYREFSKKYDDATFVCVENTLKSLQDVAGYYLRKMDIPIRIGVTGSSGKTTVKEMIASIFAVAGYRTFMTEGNLNSSTGVPLAIFKIRGCQYDVAVFEVGMNRKGEIKEITDIITPRVATITNIGSAHIGMLGSREAIACEKGEIFSHFDEESVGIVPSCEFTRQFMEGRKGKFIVLDSIYLKRFEGSKVIGLDGCLLNYDGLEIRLPLLGEHNIYNAILAIAVAEQKHIKKTYIKEALEKMKAVPGRAELKRGFTTYLFDCYNANPDSMEKAIDFYNNIEWQGRKIAILGSMLELGKKSLEEHKKVCCLISKTKTNVVFLMGGEMLDGFCAFAKTNGMNDVDISHLNTLHFKINEIEYFLYKDDEMEKLKVDVKAKVKQDDFLLLKASHGLHFEQLEDVLVLSK